MKKVWLLTTGDGSDGNEWDVRGVYSTEALAEKARKEYETPIQRPDGTSYHYDANVEEWDVDPKDGEDVNAEQ